MKCHYTPHDIAVFFLISNFTQRDERMVLNAIWKNENALLSDAYRKDETRFRRVVYAELSKFDSTPEELDELKLLMRDIEVSPLFENEQMMQDIIASYFKIIKLELKYTREVKYRKTKLRTLLRRFHYKRRSVKLAKEIKQILRTLKLKTYLRDYVPCDIAKVSVDDVIIFRL